MSGPGVLLGAWRAALRARWSDLSAATKPRLNGMVLLATAAGFHLGQHGPWTAPVAWALGHTLLGTLLVASGASILNQYRERHADALMPRTSGRPLPAGRLLPKDALVLGALFAVLGTAYLAFSVNRLAASVAALSLLLYVFCYTPMKRLSPLNTVVGAVPGALPPLIGWGASGGISEMASGRPWVLFAILFVWQVPHFMAIAWIHRGDYARAGFQMHSVTDPSGRSVARLALLYAAALVPVAVAPAWCGVAGPAYASWAAALSVLFLACAAVFARQPSRFSARLLFIASVIYLPLLLGGLVFDALPVLGA